MGDSVEIPIPDNKDVTNIVEAPNEAIQHVVAHEGRITHLEEQQAQHVARLEEQINTTRQELFTAIENARTEQASMLEGKLQRLEELANTLEKQVVEVPTEAIEDINEGATTAIPLVPEVEKTVEKAVPKGLRLRRKYRHGK
jgi:predicted  nucleic acid-binding Zn-ribbon protein